MYITLIQLREEEVDETLFPNPWVTSRILIAQAYIERVTKLFFEKRDNYTLTLDGQGDKMLFLPVPPATMTGITSVTVDDELIDPTAYKLIMNIGGHPDGRFNPKLYRVSGTWKKGYSNIVITGSFGFVDAVVQEDDSIVYSAPILIQELCKRITIWKLPKLGNDEQDSSRIISESLRDYSYTLGSSGGNAMELFGDQRIVSLLSMYTKKKFFTV